MFATTVKIDPNVIKDICLQNGKTLGDVSAQLGRSRPYLYTCCKNGSMSASSAKMSLFCGSDMIQTAFSKLKGKSSLDLMQAISYAAHMMYKMEEQKALQEKRKSR